MKYRGGQFLALALAVGILVVPPEAGAAVPGEWMQRGADVLGDQPDGRFGEKVEVSADGSTILIGSGPSTFHGAAYAKVFTWDGAGWTRRGDDIAGEAGSGGEEGDRHGYGLAMSADGTTIAIGARGADATGPDAGRVRILDWNGTTWVRRGDDVAGNGPHDKFGHSVGLSADGNTFVASGGADFDQPGQARIYDWDGAAWVRRGADITDTENRMADDYPVEISDDGNTVIVGSPDFGIARGRARVFDWNDSAWVQRGAAIDGEAAVDRFGSTVSMSASGDTVAIGSEYNAGSGVQAGHVRTFDWDGAAWVQRGNDIDGEYKFDLSGELAMSADGDTIVIGARGASSKPRRESPQAGHARIFDWIGDSWVQRSADIDGEDAGDGSGRGVAISDDGDTVLIGAPGADGDAEVPLGDARVFDFVTPDPNTLSCGEISGTAEDIAVLGFNVVVGTGDADFLKGTDGPDFILGLGGNDVILAGMGDDVVCAGPQHDVVIGGAGDDMLYLDEGNDVARAGTGDDTVFGGDGKDEIRGGDGDDTINGDNAADDLYGGRDDDTINGDNGRDTLRGGDGDDVLTGGPAFDRVKGQAGTDTCAVDPPGPQSDRLSTCEL